MPYFQPGVSIIVPCYNSEQTIGKTLISVLNQTGIGDLACEIIIADNNCTDNTVMLAEQIVGNSNREIPLHVVPCNCQGAGRARQQAFSSVTYETTIYLDDDNELEADWIARVRRIFRRHSRVGAVGGFNSPVIEESTPEWFSDFQSSYACGDQGETGYITQRGYLFGAGCAFRSFLLEEIYGHQPEMLLRGSLAGSMSSGADSELCARIILMGYELFYDQNLKLNHHIKSDRLNWSYVMAKRKASGASDVVLQIYRDLFAGRKPYDYASTLENTWKYKERMFKAARRESKVTGSAVYASWEYAESKYQTLQRLGADGWNHFVKKLSSVFLIGGYDTIFPGKVADTDVSGWQNLLHEKPVVFSRGLILHRVSYSFDDRDNMHVCVECQKTGSLYLSYLVLTSVDISGNNIYWRKVVAADHGKLEGYFWIKEMMEKDKVESAQYIGIRFEQFACLDQEYQRDQDEQRLLLELPSRGD